MIFKAQNTMHMYVEFKIFKNNLEKSNLDKLAIKQEIRKG